MFYAFTRTHSHTRARGIPRFYLRGPLLLVLDEEHRAVLGGLHVLYPLLHGGARVAAALLRRRAHLRLFFDVVNVLRGSR